MFFFIQGDAIAGMSNAFTDQLPTGFTLVEGPDLPLNLIYWNGRKILPKPQQPSPEYYWDSAINEWVAPDPPTPSQIQDWDKLISLLDSSPEWGKAYAAAEKTLKANTAFTTLLTTLTSLRKTETLEFAIARLREAMSNISGIGDFTAEEIASIDGKLEAAGFDLRLSQEPPS
ncbi:hypothetical protein A6S26_05190 [Nostoc sp. ATCC 43529]|nr:hypothetical protein A6S26_05190 [Nostoc sp. ATCC 43529]